MQESATLVRLGQILREKSVARGHFVLASGRTSDYYLDCRRTTLDPEGAWLTAVAVLDAMERRGWEAHAVGGLTLGADPIAAAVATVSWHASRPVPAFIVRKEAKEHGTGRRIEGQPPEGARVVLVEDTVTSGGSVLRAAEACRDAGLEILGAVTVVDREEGGRKALAAEGIELESLFTASALLGG